MGVGAALVLVWLVLEVSALPPVIRIGKYMYGNLNTL